MVIETIVENAIATGIIGINAPLGVLLFQSGFGDVLVQHLTEQTLSLGSIYSNLGLQLGLLVNDIWNWILYNMLIPLLLIVYMILFFAGQYYLIKLYTYISMNVFNKIMTMFESVTEKQVIDKNIRKVFTILGK